MMWKGDNPDNDDNAWLGDSKDVLPGVFNDNQPRHNDKDFVNDLGTQDLHLIGDPRFPDGPIIGLTPKAFTDNECAAIIDLSENQFGHKRGPAEVYNVSRDTMESAEDATRTGDIIFYRYSDAPWILDKVKFLIHAFNRTACRFNLDWDYPHEMQYADYHSKDNWFEWHNDGNFSIFEHVQGIRDYKYPRKLTVIVQLDQHGEDYTGAELLVNHCRPQLGDPWLDKGTMAIFPAWLKHKVTRLETGRRRSFTMWIMGPPWQ